MDVITDTWSSELLEIEEAGQEPVAGFQGKMYGRSHNPEQKPQCCRLNLQRVSPGFATAKLDGEMVIPWRIHLPDKQINI